VTRNAIIKIKSNAKKRMVNKSVSNTINGNDRIQRIHCNGTGQLMQVLHLGMLPTKPNTNTARLAHGNPWQHAITGKSCEQSQLIFSLYKLLERSEWPMVGTNEMWQIWAHPKIFDRAISYDATSHFVIHFFANMRTILLNHQACKTMIIANMYLANPSVAKCFG